MLRVYLCLTMQHDWRLVAVALAACALACGSAFFLYARSPLYPRSRAAGWIAAAGLVAGSGIWTTHFVSMLAFRTGLPEGYDAGATIGSFVAAVATSGLGFTLGALPGRGARLIVQRLAGGAVIGLGISIMHYLGMAGFRTAGYLLWSQDLVIASVGIGVILPAAALYTAWPGAGLKRQLAAAILLMAGIGGMHFTAMAAAGIVPDPSRTPPPALMSQTLMAVCAVAMMILILVLTATAVLLDVRGRNRDLMRLRGALDAMSDGLAFYDAQDRLFAWNAPYAALWQDTGVFEAGRPFIDLVRAGVAQGWYIGSAGREEECVAERMVQWRSGTSYFERQLPGGRWLGVTDRRTADGGTVSVCVDITELQKARQAVDHAHDLAQEANRIKSQFLSNMSHEIRTPMNGIVGMNSLLLMTDLTPAQRRYAEVVQASADGLMAIFDDILDIAKLEAGGVEIDAVAFNLDEMVREVEAEAQPAVRRKGLTLSVYSDVKAWPPLLGDSVRLRQVLSHLVDNAIKFTDTGQVLVDLRRRPAEAGQIRVRIEVSDTGIGVSAEDKPSLFEPFRQGDGSMTRRHGGTGVGLAICHHAVRLMGGTIGVMDRSGGGAIFWVELSLPEATKQAQTAA